MFSYLHLWITFIKKGYPFETASYTSPSQYTVGGWSETFLPTSKFFETNPDAKNGYFNEDGEPKKIFKLWVENIPAEFNRLNQSLKDFLSNNSKQKDW